MPEPDEQWITVVEAAELAGVAVSTIRLWYSGNDPDIPSREQIGEDGRRRRVVQQKAVVRRAERSSASPLGSGRRAAVTRRDDVAAALDAVTEQLQLLHSLTRELVEAHERAGRAEARAEALETELEETRQALAAVPRDSGDSERGWWRR